MDFLESVRFLLVLSLMGAIIIFAIRIVMWILIPKIYEKILNNNIKMECYQNTLHDHLAKIDFYIKYAIFNKDMEKLFYKELRKTKRFLKKLVKKEPEYFINLIREDLHK